MAKDMAKVETKPKKKETGPPKPVPWGFNPMQKDQSEINKHKEA